MAESDWEIEESPGKGPARQGSLWGTEVLVEQQGPSSPGQSFTSPGRAAAHAAADSDWEIESNASGRTKPVEPAALEPGTPPTCIPVEELTIPVLRAGEVISGSATEIPSLDSALERSGDSWQIEETESDLLAESTGSWVIETSRAVSPRTSITTVAKAPPQLHCESVASPSPELMAPPANTAPGARRTRQLRGSAAMAASAAAIPPRALRPGGISEVWPPPLELRTFVGHEGEVKRPKSKEMLALCAQLQQGSGPLADRLRQLASEHQRHSRRWHKHTPLNVRPVASDAAFWSCLLKSLCLSDDPSQETSAAA